MVLDAAAGDQADTRNKAVRLIANKLFVQPHLQDSIESFARQLLFRLTATAPAAVAATADDPTSTPSVGSAQQHGIMPALQTTTATAATPSDPSQEPQEQLQYQTEEDGTRFSGLYCALCTKKQGLLRDLLLVYGRAAAGSKAAIESVAAGRR